LNNNSNTCMNTFSRTTFFVDENNQITITMLNFIFNMNFLEKKRKKKKKKTKKNINTTTRRNSCKSKITSTIATSNLLQKIYSKQ
jgi:F0F1-type ATP synthase epsilon subunit